MGRTVLADDKIQTYVDKLFSTGQCYVGLILGQQGSQKDHAVHLVRTPEPVEDQASEEDEMEELEEEINPKPKKRRKSHKMDSLEKINEAWVSTHAKQVSRMLPGGLEVIGLFVVAPTAMIQDYQPRIRQAMFAVQKSQKKFAAFEHTEGHTERILLQICSVSRTLTCRSIDVADPKSTFRPADWRYQTVTEKWSKIQCTVGVDVRFETPLKAQSSTLLKQTQTGLQSFCQRVNKGIARVNGELRDRTGLLDQSGEPKKGRGKDKGQIQQQVFNVDMLLPMSKGVSVEEVKILENAAKMLVRGTIHSRAFVTGKATVADAELAVKNDIIRSLVSRCELLCEDIDLVEDSETRELYNTPVRVFGKLGSTGVDFCDYMFHDEKIQEVVDRIGELLDISVGEEDLELDCERSATEEDFIVPGVEESMEKGDETADTFSSGGLKYYVVAGLGGVAAAIIAGLSYFLTEGS